MGAGLARTAQPDHASGTGPRAGAMRRAMDLTKMRAALSDPDGRFPDAAMQWAYDNVAQATPALLALLTACAKAGDLTDREAVGAFYALPMLAALQETRAFPVVCALARNGDRIDDIFADFGAEFLPRLLVGIYGGDAKLLLEIASDRTVDPMVRASFLRAWCWHALRSGEDRAAACATLDTFGATIPAKGDFLRFEWAQARIVFADDIDASSARALLGGDNATMPDEAIAELEQDIAAWREDFSGQRETYLLENGPIFDAVGVLSQWFERADARDAEDASKDGIESEEAVEGPIENRYRDVGRNDPCPCGSGKKFKKCCLPKMEAEGSL